VPVTAPRLKIDAIRAAGAAVLPCASYDEAESQAKQDARESGATYISPYSDPDVIAGAGTVALEILEDLPDVEAIVVPVGGGGLVSGTAIAAQATNTGVIGAEAAASDPFTQSLRAGRIVSISVKATLADGLAGNLDPDTITFDIVRRMVRSIVVVPESAIRDAIRGLMAHERLVAEGAAATGVGAILGGCSKASRGRVAVVLSGANIDPDTLRAII
jgi:threonine dehydratase